VEVNSAVLKLLHADTYGEAYAITFSSSPKSEIEFWQLDK
jgi:hypothetical protein